MKAHLASVVVWLLAILVVFALPHPFPVLTGFAILYFPLLGVGLLLFSVIVLFTDTKRRMTLLTILIIILTSALTFEKGVSWGAKLNFYLYRSEYERIVAEVSSAQSNEEKNRICSGDCWIMSEDDNRVGFHYAHSFLNWHDIVYDSTGRIQANDWETKKRLNVYLVRAEPITGSWYVGHFAD